MLFNKLFFTIIVIFTSLISATQFIKSSSLLTCMDNSQFTASYFNIVFYPKNRTVYFDVTAISSINNKKVGAYVNVIAYGLNILQRNVSLCDLDYTQNNNPNNNPLCPLTSGHLDLDSSYELGKSVTDQIPGVAYTIPDLDARVKVLVYDIETYDQLACVEATLSNGKTVQTKYAAWPIAAVSGLGVITSGVISVIGHSNTAAHIASNSMSLFIYFQSLAITAMMAVARVPPIAAAWAQNFMWSLGLVRVGFVQNIANWYVQSTGGTPTDIIGSQYLSISVQKKKLFKRAVSTVFDEIISSQNNARQNLVKRANVMLDSDTFGTSDNLDPNLYSTDEKSDNLAGKILVLRGIQRAAYLLSIEITNIFMTGICFLFFFAFVMIVCLMLFKAIIEILVRSKIMNEGKFNEFRQQWSSIIKGSIYRLLVIALPQISLLCIWELTVRDSAGTVVVAVFLLVLSVVLLYQGAIRVFLKGKKSVKQFKNPAYLIFGDGKFLNRFGFLYVQFRADCYWFILVSLFYIFIKSLLVAVLQKHGKPQSVIIWAIELIYLIILCWIRPFMDKRTNAFNITISVINFINALFFMFFSAVFGQPNVVSSVMAVVYFVLNAVFALFLLLFTIITCVLALVYTNPDTRYQPMKDDRVSFLPRSGNGKNGGPGNGNDDDMELMALGATAMKGHEHGGPGQHQKSKNQSSTLFDDEDDSYEEDSVYQRTRNLSGPGISSTSGSGSNYESKRDSISFMEPTQPGSTIVGNPYNALPQSSQSNIPHNTGYSSNSNNGNGFSYGKTDAYQGSVASPQNPYFQQTSYSNTNNNQYQQRNPNQRNYR
ncbi:FLC2 [Candida pseudojiufengensis]|uniref:FLC2 n=1 Tax=Candida pseudojiufengensis TaxID=497109 RepID=UPI0022249CF5|nr:FLC2 [Candida pseudojiufengensis]KAI5962458.1 FLC2 [Candida pseudojiufengensis]